MHRHDRDAPHKGKFDGNSNPERKLDAPYRIDDTGEHTGDTCHPQWKVDPVAPGATGAPTVAQAQANPIVQAALGIERRTELGHHQAIGKQKRNDEEDPPEELHVTHGRCRSSRLDGKDNADDREDDLEQGELFTCHGTLPLQQKGWHLYRRRSPR